MKLALTDVRFNFLFLLSGAGKFNYQGTKRWIDDNLDSMGEIVLTSCFIQIKIRKNVIYSGLTYEEFCSCFYTVEHRGLVKDGGPR